MIALLSSAQADEVVSRLPLFIIAGYFSLLVVLGIFARRVFRGTSSDFFVAGRSIGPFLLLMSLFGTTMTAFAMVGSTAAAFDRGIGVYGLMASSSGLIHSLMFFLVGIPLWAIGKRNDFVTQIQFFRARYDSSFLGTLLFPILVALVIPYLLVGLLGAGSVLQGVTRGMFPETFPGQLIEATGRMAFVGSVPPWLSGLAICSVVLFYIFMGGVRGAAWANAFQTVVFMLTAVVAFSLISKALGGPQAASEAVLENSPGHLVRAGHFSHLQFVSYMFVPLSVGMFPHLFQHWLTAKSANTFRLPIVAHPFFIMLVWVPCILIGIWAVGMGLEPPGGNSNAILGMMVDRLLHDPLLTGIMTAGILAAIMSSLDSQFVCLGTMFTHDIVVHWVGKDRFSDRQKVVIGRMFVVTIVALVYVLSLFPPAHIFDLGVWCFSGFASLFPLVIASLYWRRATRAGAFACVLVMAGVWGWFFYDGLVRPILAGEDGGEGYLFLGMMPVVPITLASAAALILVSLMTRPPERALVDRFLARRSH